jgi:thioredoxin-like negative regulator of GroEL
MVLDGEGAEVDWIVGYSPPAEKFKAKVEKALAGVDSFKALAAAHAANPKDVPSAFKLGRKFAERARDEDALRLFRSVVALDPEGKAGSFTPDYLKAPVAYLEYAEYEIARIPLQGKRDPAGMRAFLKKYPDGPMARMAYSFLDIFFIGTAPEAEADAFYAEYTSKFPAETYVLQKWLGRKVKDKANLEKGRALAERLEELTRNNPDPYAQAVMAEYYLAAGDKAKAEELFGRPFYESYVSNLAFGLLEFAAFWAERGENLDNAEAAAEAALKVHPDYLYARQQAASVYLKLGREAKAFEVFGPAFAIKFWDEPGELRSYIYFWTQQGKNLDGALAAARRTLELRPRAYYHWSALSDLLLKMGNRAEAITAAEKAVEFASPAARPAMQKNLDKVKGQALDKK